MRTFKFEAVLIIISFTFIITPVLSQKIDLFKEGYNAFIQNDFDKAITFFTKLINEKNKYVKSNIKPLYYRGLCYFYKQMPENAISDFTLVLKIDKNHADAYNSRGLTYTFVDSLDNAMEDFNKAIELAPTFAEAYLNRGNVYVVWLNYDAALKDFTQGIKYNPNNPELYYQRGIVYYKKKMYEEAIVDFTNSIKYGLRNPKVYYSRANAYYRLNKYQEAIDDYTKALKLNPNDTEALNNRAMAYSKLGLLEKADDDRQKVKKLVGNAPEFPPIDSVKFTTYIDSSTGISINLPENWFMISYRDSNLIHIIISKDRIENAESPYITGVSLVYNFNMEKQFGIKGNEQLLEFWKGSSSQNSVDYYNYEIFSQKIKYFGKYYGFINKSRVVLKEEIPPFRLYEVVLAKEPSLFYGYFQSLEENFSYYQQIYDKAIESLKLP